MCDLRTFTADEPKPWLNIRCEELKCETLLANVITSTGNAVNDLGDIKADSAEIAGVQYATPDLGAPNFSLHTDGAGSTFWAPDAIGVQQGDIVWRPGGVSANNVFATWAEIVGAVLANQAAITVFIDTSIVSPAVIDAPLNGKNNVTLAAYKLNAGSPTFVSIALDITLTDIASISGPIVFTPDPAMTIPAFAFSNGSIFVVAGGSVVSSTALTPTISVPDNEQLILSVAQGAGISNTGTGSPFVQLGSMSQLIYVTLQKSNPTPIDADLIAGPADATVVNIYDGSGPAFNNSAFLGTLLSQPINNARFIQFTGAQAGVLGDNVSDALDLLQTSKYGVGANPTFSFLTLTSGLGTEMQLNQDGPGFDAVIRFIPFGTTGWKLGLFGAAPDFQDLALFNQSGGTVVGNFSLVTNKVSFDNMTIGPVFGATTYTMPAARAPGIGYVLSDQTGTGATSWTLPASTVLTFGGNLLLANDQPFYSSDYVTVAINVPAVVNTAIVPHSSYLREISYNTGGDNTTQISLIVNGGVSFTFTQLAASGVYALPVALLLNQGDGVGLSFAAGTAPSQANFSLFLSS